MSGDRELYAALLGLRRRAPATQLRCPIVPYPGGRWWGANPESRQGRTRPPPPTTHPPERR
jgi:hypothetical protein